MLPPVRHTLTSQVPMFSRTSYTGFSNPSTPAEPASRTANVAAGTSPSLAFPLGSGSDSTRSNDSAGPESFSRNVAISIGLEVSPTSNVRVPFVACAVGAGSGGGVRGDGWESSARIARYSYGSGGQKYAGRDITNVWRR